MIFLGMQDGPRLLFEQRLSMIFKISVSFKGLREKELNTLIFCKKLLHFNEKKYSVKNN